jgi:CHRD domain
MRSRRALVIVFAVALSGAAAAQWQLEAVLSGANVVPPAATSATGVGVFTLNQASSVVSYFLLASPMPSATATVRLGFAGQNGPVLFTLSGGPTTWEGLLGPLFAADVVTLLKQGMYVTVTSASFPNGEIRGQIQPTKKSNFSATMTAAQVVPPTASQGSAASSTRLNEPDGVLVYEVNASGVANGSSMTARLGAPGQNGPILFTLFGAGGQWCGVSPFLSASDVAAVKAGGLYYQVESPAFPGGEIRGQLVPALAVFSCVLDGTQAVPPTNSPATGCGWLELDPGPSTASFHVSVAGLSSPVTGAHLHAGVTGEAGAVVSTIPGGPTLWTGAVSLGSGEVDALYRGNLFFDVHTTSHPLGEIRGQIRPDPYVFGVGLGTNVIKIMGLGYGPTGGNTVTVSAVGAVPNLDSYLFLATSSTFSTALNMPLPLLLPPVGRLYVDASLDSFIHAPNGPAGCPAITFSVPTDPALICFKGYAQFATIDPINAFNFVLSDALELTILP